MQGDLSPIDEHLESNGVDGYLIEAGSDTPDQGYLSGFWAPDPFVTLYAGGEISCLVSPLEFNRAKEESLASAVESTAAYDYHDRLEEMERHEAWAAVIADFCATHDVSSVSVPGRFPHLVATGLEENGLSVHPDGGGVVRNVRAIKTEPELEAIAAAQSAAEAAMERAETLIREATIDSDDTLVTDEGPLTSEQVKTAIEHELLDHRCALESTIVAGGAQAADPHDRGSGPLPANAPIIIDIFPRHKEHKYFGDLTRTFLKGEPSDTHQAWYDLTLEAQSAALDTIEAGVTGEAVHDAVCDVYEAHDHSTLRSDPETETGFIHSTGHGVGLAIHEAPSLSPTGEELEPNHVVTVEPGLYDPAVGGVRIEDLVVVTEDGYHNLTEYPKEFVLE